MITYVEMTVEEAEIYLRKSKGKKVLVAISNLEDEKDIQNFVPRLKEECIEIINKAEVVAKSCGEIINSLNAFSEKQNLFKIDKRGHLSTFLIEE